MLLLLGILVAGSVYPGIGALASPIESRVLRASADMSPGDGAGPFEAMYLARAESMIRNYPRAIRLGERMSGAVILARMERIMRGWADSTDTTEHLEADLTSLLESTMEDEHHAWCSIAYGLKRYPELVREDLRRRVFERGMSYGWPVGGDGSVRWSNHMTTWTAAGLLSAEGVGDANKAAYYRSVFKQMFDRSMSGGEIEFNSPSYDALNLLGLSLLLGSDDPEVRAMARFLLDLKTAYTAHILLPNYVYVGPESRDYAGSVDDNNWSDEAEYLLFPEPRPPSLTETSFTLSIAVSGYQPPDQLREVFLHKAATSFSWDRNSELLATTHEGSGLAIDGALFNPMHYHVLQGQVAAMGASHASSAGWPSNGHTNSIDTSLTSGQETVLTQIQPGDTADYAYGGEPGAGEDDWMKEYGGRVRRVFHRNAMIQVWDPHGKTYEFTQAHIPKYATLDKVGDWWLGAQGDAFIAYRVLGDLQTVKERADYWLVRADGNSGGIAEIAHADDYAGSFEAFKADILSRQVTFASAVPEASYQARDQDGRPVMIYVRYGDNPNPSTESGTVRMIREVALTLDDLAYPLLRSPFVDFQPDASQFRISYPGYPTLVYNWAALTVNNAPASTFADVPLGHPYHDHIEALHQAGYTAGCSTDPLMFCPEATMNRAESSVFVERGIHSANFEPPTPSSQVFADMPLESWAAKWVNGLWEDQYTAGCGTNPLVYCPWQGHTRAEGCVFYMRMLNGPTYRPPQPSQQTFADVPLDTWYAKWVQPAYDAGLIEACETSPELLFCPDDPVSRGLAAYMMVQAKGLIPLQSP